MGKNVTRLYEQFQPENYDLMLDINQETMSFKGTVIVKGKKVGRPSQRLTFHQKELKIISASAIKHDKKGDQPIKFARVNNHSSFDEVRLHSEEQLYPGAYTVTLTFEGKITRQMNGIYPCFYKQDGQEKKLIATQFESHHAREAFPCIDEPEAKATFDLTLGTVANETVLANTPIKSQEPVTGELVRWFAGSATADSNDPDANDQHTSVPAYQRTTFETTPRMSPYLLAFVTGELGYTSAKTKNGVEVRSYGTPANAELTQYATDNGVKILEFFEDYFGVPYPLSKLDMVALPDFSSGAMENWGLITYRESIMLVDDASSSIETKQTCVMVVAHEISHQWFGNLVTMKWWDDLWLNESFANMMEYRATDALYPEWNIWEQFVSHETASAKRRDSLVDVQPVKTAVHHPDEISTLFDPSIVYAKGGSLLYMLMNYIGEDAFRRGLSVYFSEHKYRNTVADDLWQALSASSDQNIGEFMNGWLQRPGYPLVSIDWEPGKTTAALTQKRFLSDPNAHDDQSEPWQVPLSSNPAVDPKLFIKSESTITVSEPAANKTLLLNHNGTSYFLPQYVNQLHLQAISKTLQNGQVDAIDRSLLLDNYTMLQRGGYSQTTDLLDLLASYQNETNDTVWGEIAVAFGETRKLVEYDDAANDQLDALIIKLVSPLSQRLGWKDDANDSAQTLHLRALAIALMAGAKDQATIDEGLARFQACTKPSDLAASTRSAVYFIAARHGSDADFQKLLGMHESVQNADERDEIAGGLTGTNKLEHYQQLLALFKTDTIRRQDLMHWFAWLIRNRYARRDTWQWLVDNWSWLEKEFSSDKSYGFFARYAGMVFSRPDELEQFKTFFDPKRGIVALSREIALGEQEITSRIAWRERNEAAVIEWLKQR